MKNKKISISKMTLSDLDSISSDLKTCFNVDLSYESFYRELTKDYAIYICAKDLNGEIIGFVGLTKLMPDADLNYIAVHKDYRCIGIGKLLMKKIIEKASNENISSIILEVETTNTKAISLYKKFNFTEIHIRKNYYGNNKDAYILQKTLP